MTRHDETSPLVARFLKTNRDSLTEFGLSSADILLIGPEFLSFYRTHSPERVQRYIADIRANHSMVILPIPRQETRPEFDYKSEYSAANLLAQFNYFHELAGDESACPLVYASDAYCLEAGRIARADGVQSFRPMMSQVKGSSVRTWIGSDGFLHKTELASLDYFDRSQVAREGAFLNAIQSLHLLADTFPKVKLFTTGRVIVELVREVLPGRPLSDSDIGRLDVLEHFHSTCLRYSKHGLFHNDLRPWNLLIDGTSVHLVDFADVSTRDQDVSGLPQVIAFLGTLLVLMGKLRAAQSEFESVVQAIVDVNISHEQWSQLWLNMPVAPPFSRLMNYQSPSEIAYSLFDEFKRQTY